MLTKKQSLEIIDFAFCTLPDIGSGWTDMASQLYEMSLEAEKKHRRGRAREYCAISVPEAARLFVVQNLANSIMKPGRWAVVDILHIRNECLYAQAFVEEQGEAIQAAWTAAGVSIPEVLSVDYAALMQPN